MAFVSLFIILISLVPSCISEPPAHNYSLGKGEGRVCFGCLVGCPTFDTRNNPNEHGCKKNSPPCFYHMKAPCADVASDYKCFIKVTQESMTKKHKVEKGCEMTTMADGCYPPNSDAASNTAQSCYCSKRLCNSDLMLMGGNPNIIEKIGLHMEASGSGSLAPGVLKAWLLLAGMVFLALVQFSDELTCCMDKVELKISQATDSDQIVGTACTNRGTSCHNVKCGANTCTEDWYIPDTNCTKPVTCESSMGKPVCRLLYYEHAYIEDQEEGSLTLKYYALQDCFDNIENDVKIGCEFHQKLFYQVKHGNDEMRIERVTYDKECFCDTEECNSNLFQICLLTYDDIKVINDTCSDAGKHGGSFIVLMIPLVLKYEFIII